jgi:hypothetical protein
MTRTVGAEVVHDHLRSMLGQFESLDSTQPLPGTRYDRDLSVENSHDLLPKSVR